MSSDSLRKKILIVDDDPENIRILASLLKDEYKVMAAVSGAEALEHAVSDNRPDLVLLDIMMPEMDGFEVCTRLKAEPRTKDIPVIFISAITEPEQKTRGFEIGAVDYITKPFFRDEILDRVQTHLFPKKIKGDVEKLKTGPEDMVVERQAGPITYGESQSGESESDSPGKCPGPVGNRSAAGL